LPYTTSRAPKKAKKSMWFRSKSFGPKKH
jgi:hypothetical protein